MRSARHRSIKLSSSITRRVSARCARCRSRAPAVVCGACILLEVRWRPRHPARTLHALSPPFSRARALAAAHSTALTLHSTPRSLPRRQPSRTYWGHMARTRATGHHRRSLSPLSRHARTCCSRPPQHAPPLSRSATDARTAWVTSTHARTQRAFYRICRRIHPEREELSLGGTRPAGRLRAVVGRAR